MAAGMMDSVWTMEALLARPARPVSNQPHCVALSSTLSRDTTDLSIRRGLVRASASALQCVPWQVPDAVVDSLWVGARVVAEVTLILKFSYSMSRQSSTMTISLPEDLKQFAIQRSHTAHYGSPSDYIRGLIREDLKRLEEERLEVDLMKGLKGKGIPMTTEAWGRIRAEALQIIKSKRT